MGKELEALNYLYNDLRLMKHLDIVEEAKVKSAYECLYQTLQHLEAIDNANPNGALECLRENRSHSLPSSMPILKWEDNFKIVEQYILKAQEQERILKIIFEKNVDIIALKQALSVKQYNDFISFKINYMDYMKLTQEEFDLLKEINNG